MIYSLDLLPVITKPTRSTSHTATLIDHIYTNTVDRLTSGIVTVDISDHLAVFCMVDTPLKKQNRQNMYFKDYSKFNTESYLHDIHTIDWNAITEQCNDFFITFTLNAVSSFNTPLVLSHSIETCKPHMNYLFLYRSCPS